MTNHQRAQLPVRSDGAAQSADRREGTGIVESLMRRITPGLHHLAIQTEKVTHPNGSVRTHFTLLPGPGRHVLRFKRTFLMVNRVRETKSMDLQSGRPWESITLTTLYSQRHIFEDLFLEAHSWRNNLRKARQLYTRRDLPRGNGSENRDGRDPLTL